MAAHNRRKPAEAEEAKKRSSSDEESEENEGFVEQSDTESSDGDKNNQPPPPKKQSTSLPHHSSSDDDTESETEIDLQSKSIPKSAPEVKLVSSKQMGEPSKASKKPRSKPSTDVHPSGVSSKRPADSPAPKKGNESKRAKKEKKTKEQEQIADDEAVENENLKSTGGDDAKKQLFQRIWSEDDEIVILKGMIDYGENQGIDPASADMNSFFDFIIKSLHVDASKSQLSEKIRRLKKKFQTNLLKSKNGDDRTFAKPHDQTCYDLSKKIWGIESNGSYSAAKVSKRGKNVDAKAIKANLGSPKNLEKKIVPTDETKANGQKNIDMEMVDVAAIPSKAEPFYRQPERVESSLEKGIVKLGSKLITGAKKLELDEKLKQLQMKEIEVYLQRLDYMREQSVLVLEALKGNTN